MGKKMMDAQPHPFEVFSGGAAANVDESLKRVFLLVNPNSGGKLGLKILNLAKPILEKAGCKLTVKNTEYAGHAKVVAKEQDLSEVDVLAIIGGDGSVHELVNGFMARDDYETVKDRVVIGIIPGGTGNTLAYDLGILNPKLGAELIAKGSTRKIDCAKVEATSASTEMVPAAEGDDTKKGEPTKPVYSINIVGYGLPTTVLKTANSLRWLGGAQYKLAAYQSLIRNKGYKCDVEYVDKDGESHKITGKFFMIQGQVTVHMGDRVPFCPDAQLDDGLLDLVLVRHARVPKILSTMLKAEKGKHKGLKLIEMYQVRSFKVTPHAKVKLQGENTVNVDGELVGVSPMEATCLPGALRVTAA